MEQREAKKGDSKIEKERVKERKLLPGVSADCIRQGTGNGQPTSHLNSVL